MTVEVHTANILYPGNDRLDISYKTGESIFAPPPSLSIDLRSGTVRWEVYVREYYAEMRSSYVRNRRDWDFVLHLRHVVFMCYCKQPSHCHRKLLACIFVKLGASYGGEISRWDLSKPVVGGGVGVMMEHVGSPGSVIGTGA